MKPNHKLCALKRLQLDVNPPKPRTKRSATSKMKTAKKKMLKPKRTVAYSSSPDSSAEEDLDVALLESMVDGANDGKSLK